MALRDWVRLPSTWIEERSLELLRWSGSKWTSGADCAAALMVLMPIAHYADETTGITKATYDELSERTGLSRAKISAGLTILEDLGVIERERAGRSSVELMHFGLKEGWCKFPARTLYTGNRIGFLQDFNLRKPAELNALKLYYLFAARRGEDTNMANISYDKISEYSGIDRGRIKTAISLLAGLGLVHVEHVPSMLSEYGISNGYRLAFIKSRVHMGTRGRGWDASDFD